MAFTAESMPTINSSGDNIFLLKNKVAKEIYWVDNIKMLSRTNIC